MPELLEAVLKEVMSAGFDVVPLDDIPQRLKPGNSGRPFAVFTFDDGYRDNRNYAWPVFRRLGLPFTVFVPANYPTGHADLWWLVLEQTIRRADNIVFAHNGGEHRFETATLVDKERAFHQIYWILRELDEDDARAEVARLAKMHRVDGRALAREILMTCDEFREMAQDPLVTFGAHTNAHYALAKLSRDRARAEILESIASLERETGRPCRHFSYPYGDPSVAGKREFQIAAEAGMATAVTTRKGLLRAHHADRLTALPRVSLNGDYQDLRYVKLFLSGVPFALRDAVKRLTGSKAA